MYFVVIDILNYSVSLRQKILKDPEDTSSGDNLTAQSWK